MMRRRKNAVNPWYLLAVPFIGAVGLAIRRLIGSRSTRRRDAISVSEDRPVKGDYLKLETGQKEPGQETKFPATPRQHAESVEAESAGKNKLPSDYESPTGHALRRQPERLSSFFVLLVPFLVLPVAIVILAFHRIPVQSQSVIPGGDSERGKAALQGWGCGSCHTIEGVTGANGTVGPALNREAERSYIAGHLRNTPDNMVQWIAHPQEVSPGVDMPDSGVPESVARDMAAYLYSIH